MNKKHRPVRRQGPVSTPVREHPQAEITTLVSLHAQEVAERAGKIQRSLDLAENELREVRRILGEIV